MRKFLVTLILSCIVFIINANITGAGYYRVRNYGSQRWASLIDNTGSVDPIASSADLHSLQLSMNTETILTDPASIVYVYNTSGKKYDVAAQGTSLEKLMDNTVYIGADGTADGQSLYYIWGTYKNFTKYISDANTNLSDNLGEATINEIKDKYINYKKWLFLPVEANSTNYFASKPTVKTSDGGLYCTLFTSFAYQPYSSNVKAYYIGRVGFGMAEMIEIKGSVPTGSPVVIQCASENIADNKMQLVQSSAALPSNALNGVYFNYARYSRVNRVAYNPSTMRVLGVCSDGSLGFVTADIDYIPANTAYLKVPAGSSPEFKCVTTSAYNSNIPDAPEQIFTADGLVLQPIDKYTYYSEFDFPSTSDLSFLFYTSSDPDERETIGAISDQDIALNRSKNGSYPFQYGSESAWYYPTWGGGDLNITLDIQYQYVNFSSKAEVNSIEVDNNVLKYADNKIYSPSGDELRIFDMSGRLIGATREGIFDLTDLPQGIYVGWSNGKSIKVAR